jgi:phage-related protein
MGDTAALGIDLAATSLEDMAGATEKLDAQYNTLGAVAQAAFRKMQLALEPFGAVMLTVANAAMPMFEEGLANVEAGMAIAAGAVESFVANMQEGMSPLDAFVEAIWDIAPQSILDALVNLRDNIIPALGLAFATYVQPVIDFVLQFVKMQDVMVAFAIIAGVVLIPIIWGILAPILAVIAVVALVVAAIALLRTAWEQNWGGIQEKTAAVIAFILPLVQGALASIQAWWAENGAAIMAAVSAHVEFVIGVFTNLFNFIMPLVQQGLAAISAWWTENGAAVMATVSAMWEFVSQGFTMAIDNLKLILKAFFQFLTGDFEGAKNTVIALVSGWWATVQTIFNTAVTNIQTAFSGIDWGAIGSSIVQGIANGIRNGAGWIVDAAKAAAQSALDAAKALLGINSPSTVFMDIGMDAGLGMAMGLNAMQGVVSGAVGNMIPVGDYATASAMPMSGRSGGGSNYTANTTVNVASGDDPLRALRASRLLDKIGI